MTEFFSALVQQEFLRTAVIAGVLASIGCGVIGSYVVVKRISFLAGGIAHAVLGGMGVALFYGLDPMSGALAAAVVAELVIGLVKLHLRQQEDTLIGAMWAVGMAVGIGSGLVFAGILFVSSFQQQDDAARAHAAHTADTQRSIDNPIALQQKPSFVRQAFQVLPPGVLDPLMVN